MACEACSHLFAAYQHSVTLFRDAFCKGSGAIGDDSRLASEEAARLSQECRDANYALVAHWRERHSDLGKSVGSRNTQNERHVDPPLRRR